MSSTTHTSRQPSPRALATASATAAGRLTGEARRKALQEHAATHWSSKACTLVGHTQRF